MIDPLSNIKRTREILHNWNKRSFELINVGINYPKVTTLTNFSELFGDDKFDSKFDLDTFNGQSEPITDYVHKPAEVILPKIYRTEFGLGNDSFSKIKAQGVKYFYNKISEQLNPDTTDCDLFLTTSKGESIYIKSLTDEEINSKLETGELSEYTYPTKKDDKGDVWRLNIKGDKMYKLYPGSKVYLQKNPITNEEVEVIVFNISTNPVYEKNRIKNIEKFVKGTKSQFIYPFSVSREKEVYWQLANEYNYSDLSNSIDPNKDFVSQFEEVKSKAINDLSNSIYTSWLKSNDVVAARIPSQAMQSFMSMKNVGYTEDRGNNVFISHIQLLLQGSDFS